MLQQERSGSVVMTTPAVSSLADQALHPLPSSAASRSTTAQITVAQFHLTFSAWSTVQSKCRTTGV